MGPGKDAPMKKPTPFILASVTAVLAVLVNAAPARPATPAKPSGETINHKALATPVIIPKLVHVSTVALKNNQPLHLITVRLANPHLFPIGLLTGPKLPPNPCKANDRNRVFIEVIRVDTGTKEMCGAVTGDAHEVLSFREDINTNPDLFAIVTDIRTGKTWKSQTIRTK
jgi:hypothetical protein